MYALIKEGKIVETTRNLRKKFPNTSFPRELPASHEGWMKVEVPEAEAKDNERVVSREIVMEAWSPCYEVRV